MYISESSLYGFIFIVGMIILLIWATKAAYKSDAKNRDPKRKRPDYVSRNKRYRELRDLLFEGYIQFLDNGFDIEWDSENDGFTIRYNNKTKELGSIYMFYDKTGEIAPKKEFTLIASYSFPLEDTSRIESYETWAKNLTGYYKVALNKKYATHTAKLGKSYCIYTVTYAMTDIDEYMKKYAIYKTFYAFGEYLNCIKEEYDKYAKKCLDK